MDYKKYDTSGVSPNKQQKKFQFQGNRQQLKKKNLKQKKCQFDLPKQFISKRDKKNGYDQRPVARVYL